MKQLYPGFGYHKIAATLKASVLAAVFFLVSYTSSSQTLFVNLPISRPNIFLLDGTVRPGSDASVPAALINAIKLPASKPKDPVNNSLPLSLEGFTAKLDNRKVVLDWETTMELNTSHFTIQRSTDGINFEDDAIVIAEGTSNVLKTYSYSENVYPVSNSLIYYRLKLVDISAGYRYSEVVYVKWDKEGSQAGIQVYPNPAVSQIRVTVPSDWQDKTIAISIYNTGGILVKQLVSGKGTQTAAVEVADLPAGLYIVHSTTGNQGVVGKFIKMN